MIAEINDTIGNATWERDETPLEVFSQSEVQKVNVLVSLLEPFERVIRESEGEKYTTISKVDCFNMQQYSRYCVIRFILDPGLDMSTRRSMQAKRLGWTLPTEYQKEAESRCRPATPQYVS